MPKVEDLLRIYYPVWTDSSLAAGEQLAKKKRKRDKVDTNPPRTDKKRQRKDRKRWTDAIDLMLDPKRIQKLTTQMCSEKGSEEAKLMLAELKCATEVAITSLQDETAGKTRSEAILIE